MKTAVTTATLLLTFAIVTHAKVLVMDIEDFRSLKKGSLSKLETLMNISKDVTKTSHKKKTLHKKKKVHKTKKTLHKKKKAHKTKKTLHKKKKNSHKSIEGQIRQSGYTIRSTDEIRSELDYCILSVQNNKYLAIGNNANGNVFRSSTSCTQENSFSFSRTVPGQNRWKIRSLKNLEFLGVDRMANRFQMLKTQPRAYTKRQVWIPHFLNGNDKNQRIFRLTNYATGGNMGIGNGKLNPKWQMITWHPNAYVGQKYKIVVR